MSGLLFSLNAPDALAAGVAKKLGLARGALTTRRFPDGESYLRLMTDASQRTALVLACLTPPDLHFMSVLQAGMALADVGAKKRVLLAPYLPYMRQDKAFQPGEAISARIFPAHLAMAYDALVTVDPHLHRIHDLSEVFPGASKVVTAAPAIARWIAEHVDHPFLIGPDEESRQWVSRVASLISDQSNGDSEPVPLSVLKKTRHGDHEVEIEVPQDALSWRGTPVLVDDMISTGHTMIEAVHALKAHRHSPICVVTHALFDQQAEILLRESGVQAVVSCNSVPHPSNAIDLSSVLAQTVKSLLDSPT